MKSSTNDKIGYIDYSGQWVIPPQFESINPFNRGLCFVSKDGTHYGVINKDGEIIQPFVYGKYWGTPLMYFDIISKDLGITQQRIRNLKVKNQLVYPPEDEEKDEWKKNFANLIKNARYDEQTKKVIISIPDPNLYLEIENFLEEKGSYIEKQLNPKLLQIRVEYYIDLIVLNEDEETRKKIRKKIKKQFNTDNKEEFDELNLGKSIIKNSVDVVSVINNISEMISPGNIIGNAVKHSLYSS